MSYILLKESSIQFNMHFPEAYIKPWTINTTILRVDCNERWLSRPLYHVPAMCNVKLHGTHTYNTGLIHILTYHWADPHTHTTLGWSTYSHITGLIHILTQHWADPETKDHWNTDTCYDGEGGGGRLDFAWNGCSSSLPIKWQQCIHLACECLFQSTDTKQY